MNTKKQNVIIASAAVFTLVSLTHLMRVIGDVKLLVNGHSISLWMSVLAIILAGVLALLNLSLIKDKGKVFWLKYVLGLIVFDALFALYFWLNNLSYLGISASSFLFFFVLDVVLLIILAYYINRLKTLSKKHI
jgi:hypothetical protein